jgi:hypothetical protein
MNLIEGMIENCGEGNISWYPERQEVISEISYVIKPKNIIEVGFNAGHSAKLICDSICKMKDQDKEYFDQPVVFLIFDICKYECTLTNFNLMADYYKKWNIFLNMIPGDSKEMIPLTLKNVNENFDLIEIDGCHLQHCVETDLNNLIDRVAPEGYIYLDDYNSTKDPTPGVDNVINSTNWDNFEYRFIDGCFWAKRKPLNILTLEDILRPFEQVDHPVHYGGENNPYEAIKVIDAWDLNFCLGNAIKYISRAGKKNPEKEIEDLNKAIWYIQHHVEKLKNQDSK